MRAEDSFDLDAVAGWLRSARPDLPALSGTPELRQFGGGASNLTYLLGYPGAAFVLRRPPAGTKAKSAHDMRREYLIQSRLRPRFPYVPTMVALCEDESVIGSEFYVMEHLEGTILRRDLPPELGLTPSATTALCRAAVDLLVELHRVDVEAVGLGGLSRGTGYVARQVAGWSGRYRAARTPDVASFEEVMGWLHENQPSDIRTCLIHNDFRFDNLILAPGEPTRVIGILDWEMATVGDPLMDLGGALAYWAQAGDDPAFLALRRQPTHAPGMLTRAEVLEHYLDRAGLRLTPEGWTFYEVFGLFRLAVIAQQIYFRFFHGQTSNPAYGAFLPAVRYLDTRCTRLIG
ncbi:MAG TPA: phosphotransferase [Candidatus Lustribacter sp.]|nr:phosphotransferase [Candidatus Lustribacter sp.]